MDASEKAKILVVDDNEENRALVLATLEDEGYGVVLAESGAEGIAAFEKERPACVLLDVRMPGMDGFVVCERIRAIDGGAHVPILFLTALRDIDTFDKALRAGGDDFLTKPVRPTELVVRVQAALKLCRMSSELREHVDLVRKQRDELLRLQLQKERLSSFLVHDLKNPVNAIDLHAQLLLSMTEPEDEAVYESLLHIREETRTLLRMFLNLLDINKTEEGRLRPDRVKVDLDALLSETFRVVQLQAQSSGVTLEEHVNHVEVSADPDLLRRIVENLLDNAIRHAPHDSTVTVTAEATHGEVAIRVADQGRGVPPELRDRIFEKFVQLEEGDRRLSRSGRGLGLAFCKLAVEAHGGTIHIEDGHPGTVFCIKLPHG